MAPEGDGLPVTATLGREPLREARVQNSRLRVSSSKYGRPYLVRLLQFRQDFICSPDIEY